MQDLGRFVAATPGGPKSVRLWLGPSRLFPGELRLWIDDDRMPAFPVQDLLVGVELRRM